MDRISGENLIRYTKNLKTYVDNSLNSYYNPNTTVVTFNITEADTKIDIKNLTGLSSIDWGDGTSTMLSSSNQSHTYKKTGTFTCRLCGVTEIGKNAFDACNNLTSVVIGDSVESVGEGAFRNCKSVTEVVVGKNAAIGFGSFLYCSKLKTVVISDGVPSIGISAFQECTSLKEVIIPSSVTSIKQKAFYACSSLVRAEIKSSITTIAPQMFRNCTSLQNILLPNSLTKIEDKAFTSCSALKSIVISKNVSTIEANTFHSCSNLTIYCECEEADKPSGWDSNWDQLNNNGQRVPVVWGYSLDQVIQKLTEAEQKLTELDTLYYALDDSVSFTKTASYKTGSCTIQNSRDDEISVGAYEDYPSLSASVTITADGHVTVSITASTDSTTKQIFYGTGKLSANTSATPTSYTQTISLTKPQLIKIKSNEATLSSATTSLYTRKTSAMAELKLSIYDDDTHEAGDYSGFDYWINSVYVTFPFGGSCDAVRLVDTTTSLVGLNLLKLTEQSNHTLTLNFDSISGNYQKILF